MHRQFSLQWQPFYTVKKRNLLNGLFRKKFLISILLCKLTTLICGCDPSGNESLNPIVPDQVEFEIVAPKRFIDGISFPVVLYKPHSNPRIERSSSFAITSDCAEISPAAIDLKRNIGCRKLEIIGFERFAVGRNIPRRI